MYTEMVGDLESVLLDTTPTEHSKLYVTSPLS